MNDKGKKIAQITLIAIVTACMLIGGDYLIGDIQLKKPLDKMVEENKGINQYEIQENYVGNKQIVLNVENSAVLIEQMEESFSKYGDLLEQQFDSVLIKQGNIDPQKAEELYQQVVPLLEEVVRTGEYSKLAQYENELNPLKIIFGEKCIYIGIEQEGKWYYFMQWMDKENLTIVMNSFI